MEDPENAIKAYKTGIRLNPYRDDTHTQLGNLLFAEGNVIKYVCRHKNKNGKDDLEKAKHYIDMIIERDYE